MFAYICLGTNNLERAIKFYDSSLAPLGLSRCDTSNEPNWEGWAGWGIYESGGAQELALWVCTPFSGSPATPGNGTMVALRANTWAEVQNFYAAALENGGTSEGPPGLRPQYANDFYATYVRDPDGNKIAVVCRGFTHA
ncbi:TPA: VOC family protein [Pseudomonas aeruginosa]|nr:VOC family protein [Pseudomonas aeruginosa]HCE6035690.1 VOC family protein [Pseudomonas aeruginosa]